MLLLILLLFSALILLASANNPTSEPVAMDQQDQQLQAPWNFSVIVLPDTQFYSQTYPAVFNNQTQWIVDTVASLNTVFVTQEGDLVNTYSSTSQWNNANSSMSKLDGNVPWAVLPGNHDGVNVGSSGENLNTYNNYFPRSRFSGQPWYGGAYSNVNSNNFELFSGGADDYLIFHFQYHPSDAVLEWANTTIANYPNRRVIVTTHDYMDVDGSRSAEGDHIWNSFVAAHADQVFLVLCGHNHGEARRTDIANGHAVYQLLADYQEGYPNGGNGWLRVLDFRPVEDKIYVRSFSPYVNQYQTDADSQFTLDYDMTSQQQITVDVQSPNDGITTVDNMPDFKFTVTHPSQLTFNGCLWLQNGTSSKVFAFKDGVVNGSLTTLTPPYPMPNGVWQWWINCTASAMNGVSAKRSVTISVFRGDKTFTSTWDGSTRTYWLDLPDNFDTSAPTPLVFFLHGFGGSRYSYSDPAKYPVLRQVFQNHTWVVAAVECRTVNGYQNWYAEPSRQDITDVLVQLRNSYNIDSSHVHIMGNSMGGGGALKYAMFNNGVIASLVDIHGITNFTQFYNEASTYRSSLEAAYGGRPSQVPDVYANESALGNEQRFSHTPVIMLHGTADTTVNVSHSRNLNLSLSVLGYAVKYVEVPGVGHDASVLVSGREMEILSWFEDHSARAQLYIEPTPVNKDPSDVGSTFTVDVKIANVTNLYGFDMNITWDSTLITYNSFSDVALDAVWGAGQWIEVLTASTSGSFKFVALSTKDVFTKDSGIQTLFTLTFNVVKASYFQLSTHIHFTLVKLSDKNSVPILHVTNDGFYSMSARASFVPLSGWTMDPLYTNAPYFLSSSTSDLFLGLDATDTSSRVTIYSLSAPKSDLGDFDHVDVSITGTANARILLRFFLDDGTGFDVVYWADPATLDAVNFDLSAYAGRTLTVGYVALTSSDGLDASIDIRQIALVAEALPPEVPLAGWVVDSSLTNSLYTIDSTVSLLSLHLDAVDTASRVTIYSVAVPSLDLGGFNHIDVSVTGTSNARVLLRFFMDDGAGFDVVYWGDVATLDATSFDLSAYAGRKLTIAYVALISSDGLNASIDITQIALVASAPAPVVPLAGWVVDSSLTNAPYTLSSTQSLLSLNLDASGTSSRVTIYTLGVPAFNLAGYDHIDVSVTGSSNARILLRFFLDDGAGFDVVYWADPATLNAISFDLGVYSGRTLTIAYVALMSSDGLDASVDFTGIAFVASAPAPVVPLSGWVVDSSLTNAAYALDSTGSLLSLDLDAVNTASRVTIYSLAVPSADLGGFDHIDVAVTGTGNARVLLRFFMDNGAGFDVVYWGDVATLDAISFDLSAYAGRTLTVAYIALMSSDGLDASIDITQIALAA